MLSSTKCFVNLFSSILLVVPTECDVLIVGNIMTIIAHFTYNRTLVYYDWMFKDLHAKIWENIAGGGRKDTLAPWFNIAGASASVAPSIPTSLWGCLNLGYDAHRVIENVKGAKVWKSVPQFQSRYNSHTGHCCVISFGLLQISVLDVIITRIKIVQCCVSCLPKYAKCDDPKCFPGADALHQFLISRYRNEQTNGRNEQHVTWKQGSFDPRPIRRYWPKSNIRLTTLESIWKSMDQLVPPDARF